MNGQAFNGKDSVIPVSFLTELIRAYDASRDHKRASVSPLSRIYERSRSGRYQRAAVPVVEWRKEAWGNVTTYAEMVNHLLGHYAPYPVMAKADETIRNFVQDTLTPWIFFHKLCNLSSKCDAEYHQQMLLGFLVQRIKLSIRSTIRSCWADNQETTLEDVAHQAHCLSDLQGVYGESVEREGRWTQAQQRSTKVPEERREPHGIMTVKITDTQVTPSKHSRSPERTCAQVVRIFVFAPAAGGDELDLAFIDCGILCRIYYCSTHVKYPCCHFKQDTQFLRAMSRKYGARFGTNSDHQKQI